MIAKRQGLVTIKHFGVINAKSKNKIEVFLPFFILPKFWNSAHNTFQLYHVLLQIRFATNKTKLDA